jgi:hypothetical protein
MCSIHSKGLGLLRFLQDYPKLWQDRITTYSSDDIVLWYADLPENQTGCHYPFPSGDKPDDGEEYWLKVKKPSKCPECPPIKPEELVKWLPPNAVKNWQTEPMLLKEITEFVEITHPDPEDTSDTRLITERVPKVFRLEDHPEIEDYWIEFIDNSWKPWSQKMRHWYDIQSVYEKVDNIRRNLESDEDKYELFVGIGLLQWREGTGTTIKRHLLTASAEVEFEAEKGILRVVPSASFDMPRVEIDMLDNANQPNLAPIEITPLLENLDVFLWDKDRFSSIFQYIVNHTTNHASHIDENAYTPNDRADEVFRVLYAPALVLRKRRSKAFQLTINKMLKQWEQNEKGLVTAPWKKFLAETDLSLLDTSEELQDIQEPQLPERVLFPLETNNEQNRIIQKLRRTPNVMVKGPPGTGKSNTIANLICHLLAAGQRILVTAQTPQALMVLKNMIPEQMQNLCITSLGSSKEEEELRKKNILGICREYDKWENDQEDGKDWKPIVKILENELSALENQRERIRSDIISARKNEIDKDFHIGGYSGSLARIAEKIEEERITYGWFPDDLQDDPPFPFSNNELSFFAMFQKDLSSDLEDELGHLLGDCQLPTPEHFYILLKEIDSKERKAAQSKDNAKNIFNGNQRNYSKDILIKTANNIQILMDRVVISSRVIGNLSLKILGEYLLNMKTKWISLKDEFANIQNRIETDLLKCGTVRIEGLPKESIDRSRLLADIERRVVYLAKGGWRGFWKFSRKIIRETNYIEKDIIVDGRRPTSVELLTQLSSFLRLEKHYIDFKSVWPEDWIPKQKYLISIAKNILETLKEYDHYINFLETFEADPLPCIPMDHLSSFSSSEDMVACQKAIQAEIDRHEAEDARKPLENFLNIIQKVLLLPNVHPCMHQLVFAIKNRDFNKWEIAWRKHEEVKQQQSKLSEYYGLLNRLQSCCPFFSDLLRKGQGDSAWQKQIFDLPKAWEWATTRTWINRKVNNGENKQDLHERFHDLEEQILEKTKEIATRRGWLAPFESGNISESTIQILKSWLEAIGRIGSGTGKNASLHRRSAQNYFKQIVSKMPAWIMPLHRLWDTIDPSPGMFDTIIIDEASQATMESLALLFLAKRIIVVGDDRQNSPDTSFIDENDTQALVRRHLADFYFKQEFRPTSSLYSHANRTFGNPISLREHFRCVPEIIRFSNEHFYSDHQMIPLRQAPPGRLPPLENRFIEAVCDGEGAKIINKLEAEAIVDEIQKCTKNKAYQGKSMGVIAMQGRAQAELIASMLSERLDPGIIQDHKIRCGEAPNFQGDQRDVIFLSLVMAKNKQFRALTTADYQRRYNVAMSRAKDQVWLFYSIKPQDCGINCLRRELLNFFLNPTAPEHLGEDRERLERAAMKRPRCPNEQPAPYGSWFEVDVALELLRRNYRIRPQYEIAGYYIDLVVEDSNRRLAVECDGDYWHNEERYNDDWNRQQQIERASRITFIRIRGSYFYANRERAMQQVIEACEKEDIRPQGFCEDTDSDYKEDEELVELQEKQNNTHSEDNDMSSPADEEDNPSDDDNMSTSDGPFSGYSKEMGFPDPRNASSGNVREALKRIIERDGPLTRTSVHNLYRKGCPDIKRITRDVRTSINVIIGAMLRSKEVIQEDELHDGKPEGLILRMSNDPPVINRNRGLRQLDEIPPSELKVIIERLKSKKGNEISVESLIEGIFDHYGFKRKTVRARKHLKRVFNALNNL